MKFVIFSVRTCYRSVCNHPFLVGVLFLLCFLYRSFPFLFSLLVSASPVLVCTVILLGTLLSFGQPNIPKIGKEEKITYDIESFKTGVSRDAIVVERDESFAMERYTGKRRDVIEKSIEEASSTVSKLSEVNKDDNSVVDSVPMIEESSPEIQLEKRVIEEAGRELHDLGFGKKSEMNEVKLHDGEVVKNPQSLIQKVEDENVSVEDDKSSMESVDSLMEDHLVCSPISPWKQAVEDDDEGADEDDEASVSGSDGAESSSPDASMADIIPMLDELHPLLDEDAPQPAHMSHDGSDAASERSLKSSDGRKESDEDTENQEEEEVGDDDNDDDDDEEETQGGKEDGTKSVITWTEEDQKNLMDLGTSELERNQRLENLIARRSAWKDLRRMMAEKNLIDLESGDLPFNIAPISTTRRNPFDIPDDTNDNMGLPPIPGSAPSILIPRRNPFDLPYDSSEEKPDLMGDGFQQESVTFHPKETFFRRHESFNVGPSFFGPPKQQQDIKLRPYFVPERTASEETNYSSFQRQSSELSESKVSSVPETESVCSAGDQDDKKLIQEYFSQEEELISNIEHDSLCVHHGSESSEDVDSVKLGQAEKRDVELDEVEIKLGDTENQHKMESSLSETGGVATPAKCNTGEIHLNAEVEGKYSRSSSSSLSEVNEKIFNEKEDEGLPSLEPRKGNFIEESGISMQPSLEEPGFSITGGLMDDSQHKEPVYDSSPPAVERNLSSSSISSDLQVEISEMGLPPVLVKRTVSFADRESEVSNQSMEKDTPCNEEMLAGTSQLHALDENESGSRGVKETSEDDVPNFGFSQVDQNVDSANASIMLESVVEHASINSRSSSDTESVEDHLIYQDESYQREQDQVPLSSFDADIHAVVQQGVCEEANSVASSSQYKSSGDSTLATPEEEQPSFVVEQVSGIPHDKSSETPSINEYSIDKEVSIQFEQDQVHSSSANANFHVGIHQEADEKMVSAHYQCVSEENSMSELEKQLPLSDKSMVALSSENHE